MLGKHLTYVDIFALLGYTWLSSSYLLNKHNFSRVCRCALAMNPINLNAALLEISRGQGGEKTFWLPSTKFSPCVCVKNDKIIFQWWWTLHSNNITQWNIKRKNKHSTTWTFSAANNSWFCVYLIRILSRYSIYS